MSGRKNILNPYTIVPTRPPPLGPNTPITGDLSSAFFSPATEVKLGDSVTYQINISTSDSTGTFFAQCSDDGIVYSDIGLCGVVSAEDDVSNVQIDPADSFFYRIRYEPTIPGTGTCQIIVGWKAKGG